MEIKCSTTFKCSTTAVGLLSCNVAYVAANLKVMSLLNRVNSLKRPGIAHLIKAV